VSALRPDLARRQVPGRGDGSGAGKPCVPSASSVASARAFATEFPRIADVSLTTR